MKSVVSNWTSDDFIAFLYINVISDDYIISESEHDEITHKIGLNRYKNVLKKYIQYPKKEIIILLKLLSDKHFATTNQQIFIKERVYELICFKNNNKELEEKILQFLIKN